jgi:hypothetical protein
MVFSVSIPTEDQGEFVAMSRTGQAAIEMDPRVETNHDPLKESSTTHH